MGTIAHVCFTANERACNVSAHNSVSVCVCVSKHACGKDKGIKNTHD